MRRSMDQGAPSEATAPDETQHAGLASWIMLAHRVAEERSVRRPGERTAMNSDPTSAEHGQPREATGTEAPSRETPRQPFAAARRALCFLTRLPLPPPRELAALGRSPVWFPLVGLLLGLLGWAAYLTLSQLWPEPSARGLVLLGALLIADAFHLDGLADCADGLYGGRTYGTGFGRRCPHFL